MSYPPYPWQREIWTRLTTTQRDGRLGHALLMSGRPGVGKSEFARAFAAFLLCEAPQGDAPCEACRGCLLRGAGNHPDYALVVPEEDAKAISIDQIRGLIEFFTLKSHYGGPKIAVIEPADGMARAAANALLKLLEEPPPGAVLCLVASRAEALLPTLRSRCQRLALDKYPATLAAAWLEGALPANLQGESGRLLAQCGGGPLAALALVTRGGQGEQDEVAALMAKVAAGERHALHAAGDSAHISAGELLDAMVRAAQDQVWRQYDCAPAAAPDRVLNGSGNALNLRRVFEFMDTAFEFKGLLAGGSNVREADVRASVWLSWMQAARTRPQSGKG